MTSSPPQPPVYPAAPQHPYAQRPQAPLSALALIAFVGSFFFSLVGIVCGHIALARVKRTGERGRGFALAGTIIGYVRLVAEAAVVVTLIVLAVHTANAQSPAASTRGPEGMASGGAVFGERGDLVSTGSAEGDSRTAYEVDRGNDPLDVTIYVDYMCPACGNFEQRNGDALAALVESGDITLQVYPVNFLDPTSLGTNYSTRAANLFACTVEYDPDAAFDVHNRLLSSAVQPAEGTEGLTDGELVSVAKEAGADGEFESCVSEQRFASFFDDNTRIATQEGLLGLASGARMLDPSGEPQADGPQRLTSTPTVIVAGEQFVEQRDGDLGEFIADAMKR